MKILICPDKFKSCLTAAEVAGHIRSGILRTRPEAECKLVPLADGGDGTAVVLTEATQGHIEHVVVCDPLMRKIPSFYGISGDGATAIIEMAAASGLSLLKSEERNPLNTTTYGTGELIRYALDHNCDTILLGIGGSATVDGGVGMAQALGISFTDATGNEMEPGGANLGNIYHIDLSGIDPRIKDRNINVLCDVTTPLTGPDGAAFVFGPQKGADPDMVRKLDDHLWHLSRVIFDQLGVDISTIPGGGAAGGLGAGLVAFLNARLHDGFGLISEILKLDESIEWADLVITGEGRIDFQTAFGKTASGIARMASEKKKAVIAFTGAIESTPEKLHDLGFTAVVPITDKPMTLRQSMDDAGRLLENAAEQSLRLIGLTI